MKRQLHCQRCQSPMSFMMREHFQKGDCHAWVGNLNFSFRGGLEMEVYCCPKCGKLEFFLPEDAVESLQETDFETTPEADAQIVRVSMDGIPQVRCPNCGKEHDFDYPRCPRCDYVY